MRAVQLALQRFLSFDADLSQGLCAALACLLVSFFFPAVLPQDRIPHRLCKRRCWTAAAATGTRLPDQRVRRERDLLRLPPQHGHWQTLIEWFWGLPPLEPRQDESAHRPCRPRRRCR